MGVEWLGKLEQALVDWMMAPGYSDQLSRDETKVVEMLEISRVQKQAVYDQLARLTRPKHFDLEFENRDPLTGRNGTHRYE
ncbi:hypothetical protein BGZ52_009728, partial [Haplosporangium bisporale]